MKPSGFLHDGQRDQEILDVQRFGDRLDLLAREPDKAKRSRRGTTEQSSHSASTKSVLMNRRSRTSLSRHCEASARNRTQFPSRDVTITHTCAARLRLAHKNLVKMFGSFTAVNNVSLEIKYGEVYGLLGANGAGKTTTIKMLCGLLEPTHGQIRLAGESGSFRSADVRMRIGYMSQKFSLYNDLSIKENLNFFAGVYGVPEDEREEKLRWVLSFSGLEGRENQITGSLPGGWKQRVAFRSGHHA